jgi:DNA polymerase-4
VGSQCALGRRARTPAELDAVLVGLVDRVTRRLRAGERRARTVVLRIRFDDFSRASRSHSLAAPTARTDLVLGTARGLLAGCHDIIATRVWR